MGGFGRLVLFYVFFFIRYHYMTLSDAYTYNILASMLNRIRNYGFQIFILKFQFVQQEK
ncbi:hypothetical protein DPMN_024749 [Dreissena polymorpha]|uniref:Uncharacterized protein n=1 Tax=Dreissena polymorpha TaxID=45954 RepID=A0A9D4LQC2_DREPO|nr:hypothetical protein DPMN_024749 [Dreissena polymorpha]